MKLIPAGARSDIISTLGVDIYNPNPTVIHTAYENELDEDGTVIMEMVTTNFNDAHELRIVSNSLIGRTDPGRGPAQVIEPVYPLYLEDRKLRLNSSLEGVMQILLLLLAGSPVARLNIVSSLKVDAVLS